MAIRFAKKTRKNYNKHQSKYLEKKHIYAKKGTQLKCRLKTCKTKIYQTIYGGTLDGNIRSLRQLYF